MTTQRETTKFSSAYVWLCAIILELKTQKKIWFHTVQKVFKWEIRFDMRIKTDIKINYNRPYFFVYYKKINKITLIKYSIISHFFAYDKKII